MSLFDRGYREYIDSRKKLGYLLNVNKNNNDVIVTQHKIEEVVPSECKLDRYPEKIM